VFLIRFVCVLSRVIFVVVILSHVSCSFIFLHHLVFISLSVCSSSWIVLSHLRTHMRWADSDTVLGSIGGVFYLSGLLGCVGFFQGDFTGCHYWE
jgi:hypothetical protein